MEDPQSMGFGSLSSTLGAMLIAVIFNTFLYGIVAVQYASYYTTQFRDPDWIKWVVSVLFITDTVHSSSLIYLVWLYLIEGFANPHSNIAIHWPLPLSIFIGGFTALVVQMFLCYRILVLCKMRVAVGLLGSLSVALFSISVLAVVRLSLKEDQRGRNRTDNIVLSVWKPLEAFLNLLISGFLLYAFRSASTTGWNTDRVLKRLVRMTIQTGLCTAIFALLVMTIWLAKPRTNWFHLFALSISRVYTTTLLDTLISRPKLREMMGSGDTTFDMGTETGGVPRAPSGRFHSQAKRATMATMKFKIPHHGRLSTRGNVELSPEYESPVPSKESISLKWPNS